MPERQCNGCTRQADWGCQAFKYETTKDDRKGRKERDGRYWAWHKPAHYPLTVDGEDIWSCPRQPLKQDPKGWDRLLFYFGFFQKGFLPQAGAVVDQTNKAMELFRVLEAANEAADAEVEAVKRRKTMNERGNSGPPGRPPPRGT